MVVVRVADDMSVSQFDVATGILGDVGVVGHEDDGASLGV